MRKGTDRESGKVGYANRRPADFLSPPWEKGKEEVPDSVGGKRGWAMRRSGRRRQ